MAANENMSSEGMPARGVYVLWLSLAAPATVRVGALGHCDFPAGRYAYAGSAQNGLWPRLARHARSDKAFHWHIDYLLAEAALETVMAGPGEREDECRLAAWLLALPGAELAVPRFGASDCGCGGHLVRFSVAQEALLPAGSFRVVPLEALANYNKARRRRTGRREFEGGAEVTLSRESPTRTRPPRER